MSTEVCYSWENIESFIHTLKTNIHKKPDIVVSIGRGGLIPGAMLAQRFNCSVLNMGIKSYKGFTKEKILEYQPISNFEHLRDLNILVVDDIADSGETLEYVSNKFKANWCDQVQTATLFYKSKSIAKPDFYAREIQNEEWVVFPWEKLC